MHPNILRNKLSGVIAFPITPFKEDLSLDLPRLHENLNKLLEYPISAIVTAGTTGEMYALTPAEHLRVIELRALAVEDLVPVHHECRLWTTTRSGDGAGGRKSRRRWNSRFPAVLSARRRRGMFEYYRSIGRGTRLGMIIYSRDWATFTPALVDRLTRSQT